MAAAIVTTALEIIPELPKVITAVQDIVKTVEGLFGHKTGTTKKQAALNMASDMFNVYQTVAPFAGLTGANTSQVESSLSNLIDSIVAFYNATGVFVKTQKK